MKRIAVSSICALAFLMMLSGCASDFQRESVLDARAEDPQGLISGIPAQGEKVCLAAGSFHSTELDISVHRALRDRGYIVTFLKGYEEPNPPAAASLSPFRGLKCPRRATRPHPSRSTTAISLPAKPSAPSGAGIRGRRLRAGGMRLRRPLPMRFSRGPGATLTSSRGIWWISFFRNSIERQKRRFT